MQNLPRVLVIEDEAHIARLLQFVLTKNGYEVAIARDGKTALNLLNGFSPHAVLLDLNLPDVPGLEVLSSIRKHPVCSEAGVVIISAHTMDYEAVPASAAQDGRTVRCSKPIAPSRLLESLNDLGIRSPGAGAGAA